jgi:lysine 6-dehydrogenase
MSYLILGAGLMGRALVHDLIVNSGVGPVTVVDMDMSRLEPLVERYGAKGLSMTSIDINDRKATARLLAGHDVLVNATSYTLNVGLTRLAIDNHCHMLDLGGNMTVVEEQLNMSREAEKAGVTILPNCGLAPGMANVLGAWLLKGLDVARSLKIFVGGLPIEPVPPLCYMQLFSVQGLINEYVEPVDAIIGGKLVRLPPLEDVEHVEFPEPFGRLEAFNTSGGISMMVKDHEGRMDTMYYKTLRYPGHCAIFKAMLDMGLMGDDLVTVEDVMISPRAILEDALARHLPKEGPDATLMHIEAKGIVDGKETTRALQMVDKADPSTGMSSMMRTTAFPTSIIARFVHDGDIDTKGVMTPEKVVDGKALMAEMDKRAIRPRLLD